MKRRMNHEGTIIQKEDGKWVGQVMDGYKENGKRNVVTIIGSSRQEVLNGIKQYWDSKDIIPAVLSEHITFDRWAEMWYRDYATEVQASTHANYRYTLKALTDHFRDTELADIKPLHINHFHDYLKRAGYSFSYISKCRAMLIQIFDSAQANDLISKNPARLSKGIKNMSSAPPEGKEDGKDAFTDSEVEQLFRWLPDDLLGHSIRLLLGTGMRTQELLALTAKDIQEDGSVITVSKAIKTVGGNPTLGSPKSTRGRRLIPVPQQYRADALFLRKYGANSPQIWMSERESGLYDVNVFRKKYYRLIDTIPNIRRLSPHCCRHTYISRLEKHGIPMEQIARLAGHSRITTTDGYLHTDMDTLFSAVSVLNTDGGAEY